MKKDPDQILKQFGMDPQTVLERRRDEVNTYHAKVFDSAGKTINKLLDFCIAKGFGNASKLRILEGMVEPGLYALALCLGHRPDMRKAKREEVPFDAMLFAGLYCAVTSDCCGDKPKQAIGREMQYTHELFERITGRTFRDCFLTTCGCANCKARRKKLGIKFDPGGDDRWL